MASMWFWIVSANQINIMSAYGVSQCKSRPSSVGILRISLFFHYIKE